MYYINRAMIGHRARVLSSIYTTTYFLNAEVKTTKEYFFENGFQKERNKAKDDGDCS
jgi:hypothetical protein